jgi:hypothetical protein
MNYDSSVSCSAIRMITVRRCSADSVKHIFVRDIQGIEVSGASHHDEGSSSSSSEYRQRQLSLLQACQMPFDYVRVLSTHHLTGHQQLPRSTAPHVALEVCASACRGCITFC